MELVLERVNGVEDRTRRLIRRRVAFLIVARVRGCVDARVVHPVGGRVFDRVYDQVYRSLPVAI